jgi:hypothetical protein
MTLKWRDLVTLRPYEIALDLVFWIPWFLLAWWSVVSGIWALAAIG